MPCAALFTVYFHVPCIVLFIVHFHAVISMFRFFCYRSHLKASAVNQMIQFFKIKNLPLVSQSNVEAKTDENQEHTKSIP